MTTSTDLKRIAVDGRMRYVCALAAIVGIGGCQSPSQHRVDVDKAANQIVQNAQQDALGRTEPFVVEPPAITLRRKILESQELPISGEASLGSSALPLIEHWPEPKSPAEDDVVPAAPWNIEEPFRLTLLDALGIGANNSREYQSSKETVFRSALDLELARDDFRNTFAGIFESLLQFNHQTDPTTGGAVQSATASVSRKLKSGATLAARIGIDLVQLLSGGSASSLGVFADATVTLPLLRGAGEHIIREPLTQAERSVIYAIYDFERFKRSFAVTVASEYLGVLQSQDQLSNAESNYRRLIASAGRARRLADAGRLPEIQVDQARQDELRARDRWVAAQASYERELDRFKLTLGLPADSRVELDRKELERLVEVAEAGLGNEDAVNAEDEPAANEDKLDAPGSRGSPGPLEMKQAEALSLAFDYRLDLRVSHGETFDAQRKVVVAADALKAGVDLTGGVAFGERRALLSARSPNSQLRANQGIYALNADVDLPWERTAESIAYRDSLIDLEEATRATQLLEDTIKQQVRNSLRGLWQARESYWIQRQAVKLAERRVDSTSLFLEAGRAEIRDLLEAQEALISAQNGLTEAIIDYRIAELELQRDTGTLTVDEKGMWREYDRKNND